MKLPKRPRKSWIYENPVLAALTGVGLAAVQAKLLLSGQRLSIPVFAFTFLLYAGCYSMDFYRESRKYRRERYWLDAIEYRKSKW